MPNLPTDNPKMVWTAQPQVGGAGRTDTNDILHVLGPAGEVASWIDYNGIGQGGFAGNPGPVGPTGPTGSITAAAGPSPWFDVQAYGAKPRKAVPPSTTATTFGTTLVTLANAEDFVNGDGLVIFTAGAATAQSTPAAPTVTAPPVSGSATYNYKIVGVDALGGLTAASLAGQTTVGPAVFGNNPVAISSISQTANVVTVNFSSAINAVVGMQIAIKGFTTTSAIFNGFWAVATAPTTSQITFALTGNFGAGTVSGSTTGRLCNTYTIAAISRSGSTISITTNANHNFNVQSGSKHTICIVDGVTPADLNGQYIVSTASGTGLTCAGTAISATETGVVTQNSTVTVYEYVDVACPLPSLPTVSYYIYGDYGTGTYSLLGKSLPGQSFWRDWGPWMGSGFTAPSYVPATPPAAAQNQMYAGIIVSGAGTTSLVMNTSVPASASGATVLHDEGITITTALTAANAIGGGTVFLSPSSGSNNYYYYVNSPVTVPTFVTLELGSGLTLNETLTLASASKLEATAGPESAGVPQFGIQSYARVRGAASPLVNLSSLSEKVKGVLFSSSGGGNGQFLLHLSNQAAQVTIRECAFATNFSTCVPLIIEGALTETRITDCSFGAYSGQISNQGAGGTVPGTIAYAPHIPALWMRIDDATGQANSCLLMDGRNNFAGRGILIDRALYTTGATFDYIISAFENQGPVTPFVMLLGSNSGSGLQIHNVLNDSSTIAVVANWSVGGYGQTLLDATQTSGTAPLITGNALPGAVVNNTLRNIVGQNYNCEILTLGNTVISAGLSFAQVLAQHQFSEPVILTGPTPYPLAVQQPAPILTSATVSGVGTLNNTYLVQVAAVGWNNGTTQLSNGISVSPALQQIVIDWDAVSNVQGYNVYLNGILQNSSPIAALTVTLSSFGNDGTAGSLDGTGLPLMDSTQVATLLLRLASGLNKVDVAAGTLTGNRTATLPDASGTVALFVAPPAHNSSTGVAGQMAYDGTYLYICSAPNTWQRVAVGGSW